MQAYDYNVKEYMPVTPGIGMHVEVSDPDQKVVLSRVSFYFYVAFFQVTIRCRHGI